MALSQTACVMLFAVQMNEVPTCVTPVNKLGVHKKQQAVIRAPGQEQRLAHLALFAA
jgi:hypothetical protein